MRKGINKYKIQICFLTGSLFFVSSPWTWIENYKTWAIDTFEIRVRLLLHGNMILDKQIFKSLSSLFIQRGKKASMSVVPFISHVFVKFFMFYFTRFVSGNKHFYCLDKKRSIDYFDKAKVNNYELMRYTNCISSMKIKKHDQKKFYNFLYVKQTKIWGKFLVLKILKNLHNHYVFFFCLCNLVTKYKRKLFYR